MKPSVEVIIFISFRSSARKRSSTETDDNPASTKTTKRPVPEAVPKAVPEAVHEQEESSDSQKPHKNLSFYGDTVNAQNQTLKDVIVKSFVNLFPDIERNHIHNFYLCSDRKCTEISADDTRSDKRGNRFLHKWIFDPDISHCKHAGIWSLTYIEGKGMFCALCNMHNTKQPTNDSKVWNSEASIRCRPGTILFNLKYWKR